MSNLYNYDAAGTAETYDRIRFALGANVIAGLLHIHCGKPLKDIHVLDAGCGTGLYAKVLIDMGIGKMSLLDASSEMLGFAKEMLKDAVEKNVVDAIIEARLPDFPFEDAKFDAVLFNQVLHHLDKDWNGTDFPVLEKTLLQTKRILRQNGLLLITTALPSTIKESIWFTQIHPDIAEKLSKTFLSVEKYLTLFAKYGFQCLSAMNFLTTSKSPFMNPEGPLNEKWRKATSMFEVAGQEKEKEMIQIVLDMKEKGTLNQFVTDHDRTSEIGKMTLFVCISI